jgi:hypothetical protein
MGTLSEKDPLDPGNPIYYAPRRMREENPQLPASTDTMGGLSSPSSIDTLLKQAVSKSFRTLDPVAMNEPPALQWRDLIPAAARLAAAVGVAGLAALFVVLMIPAAKNQAQDSDASSLAEAPKTASDVPKTSSETQAPREEEATPALAEFGTILAASRTVQPTAPAMTHEQSEALLQQFLRWRDKLDSTDTPPR